MTRASLSRAAIVIDAVGISAQFGNRLARTIRWEEVTQIVKSRVPSGAGTYSNKYRVMARDRGVICRYFVNVCGDIVFDERIQNSRRLLDELNVLAVAHSIPLRAWDLQAIAQKEARGDKQLRGSSEVTVEKF